MVSLAQQFLEYVGPSRDLPVFHPPREVRSPLKFFDCLSDLENKSNVTPSLSRQLAKQYLAMNFKDSI